MTVQRGAICQQLLATGDIRADARVEVFPKIEGHLRELRVEEGDRVRAGQVLAQIADDVLQAEVARATAQVDALRAEWAEMQAGARPEEIAQAVDRVEHSRAEFENTEWMLERTRALVERGVQSTQELEEATRKITQARAAHSIAQTQLQLLRAGERAPRSVRPYKHGCGRHKAPCTWLGWSYSMPPSLPRWTVLSAADLSIQERL
jgi:multidrug resistance efflux pump